MRNLVLAASLTLFSTTATAQVVEVGGSLASACLGSDGSMCGSGHRPMAAAYASLWPSEGVELTFRLSRVPLTSFGINTTFPTPVSMAVTRRSRQYISGLFTYHFRRGESIRPILGFGFGGYAQAQNVQCQSQDCSGVPGLPPEGHNRTWMTDVILLAGLSGPIGDRWTWRGGWLSHRFANDHHSTIELFAGIGYRFGN